MKTARGLIVLILLGYSLVSFSQVKLDDGYTPKDPNDIRNAERNPASQGPSCTDSAGKQVFKGQSEYDICVLRDRANREVRRAPYEPGSQFKY